MKWNTIIKELKLDEVLESQAHPHVPEEKSHLFHTYKMHRSAGSEFEVYNFLYSIVLLFKPTLVLETGTQYGISSLAIGCGLEYNGFGKLISLDVLDQSIAKDYAKTYNLNNIEYIQQNSLEFIKEYDGDPFDFVLFDSDLNLRVTEFKNLRDKNKLNKLVCFHDTSRLRGLSGGISFKQSTIDALDEIAVTDCLNGIENHLSRGFRFMEVNNG